MPDETTSSATSASLLVRLRQSPAEPTAWAEFVQRYGGRIDTWCRRWGLQAADAQDVSQDVLLKLTHAMQAFRYDPSLKFRSWLKTVVHHAWQDLVRGRRLIAIGGDAGPDDPMNSLEARDDLAAHVTVAYEQELLQRALERVRQRVQPQTWSAFHLTTFEGLSGAEAAVRLGMPVTSVYKAKSNVQKLLESEVRELEEGEM